MVLPGLLDCNPFPVDSSEPCWKGGVGFPEPVRRVLQVHSILMLGLHEESQETCFELELAGRRFPSDLRCLRARVLAQVFQSAQELLRGYQVHPEIQAQMFAYLFFFSNVSLFNQLMDKGKGVTTGGHGGGREGQPEGGSHLH